MSKTISNKQIILDSLKNLNLTPEDSIIDLILSVQGTSHVVVGNAIDSLDCDAYINYDYSDTISYFLNDN